MADKKEPNDEYKMPDLDGYSEENYEQPSYESAASANKISGFRSNPVLQKAAIVVVVVVVVMVAYRSLGSMFGASEKKETSAIPVLSQPKSPSAAKIEPPAKPLLPMTPAITPTASGNNSSIEKKVARIEISQQTLRDDVSNITEQVGTVNGNVSGLSDKISSINQNIQALMDKLDEQASQLHRLQNRAKAKEQPRRKKITVPKVTWNVQAVVPGRAWLIASNGSTLTVRNGSVVPGVGTVSMIDTEQGRVVLRSGRVIRFSSQDS